MPNRSHAAQPPVPAIEWPTVLLCLVIYSGWFGLTLFYRHIPWPLLALAGGWCIAWHMSLQHELLHGHPTRSRRLNDALGFAPLTLWLPYQIYRLSHLRHHRDEHFHLLGIQLGHKDIPS